jgi:GNAT superfamily N-acetyltransferase
MIVRPMFPADVAALAEWMVEVPLWQRYGLTVERITRQFEQGLAGNGHLSVSELDGIACGFTWMLPVGGFGRSPYLKQIGVHPAYTGKRLGAALLQHVERQAQTYSKQFFLLVSDFNLDAQRFYKRQGYQQVGAIPAYVLPDVAELIFYKVFTE